MKHRHSTTPINNHLHSPFPSLLSLMKFFPKTKKYRETLFSKQSHPVRLRLMLISQSSAGLIFYLLSNSRTLLYPSTPVFCGRTVFFHCLLHLGPVLTHRNLHLVQDNTSTFRSPSPNAPRSPPVPPSLRRLSPKDTSISHPLPEDCTFSSIKEAIKICLFLKAV